jgi:hypothetical protein
MVPRQAHIHGRDIGNHIPQLDALALQRPWPVDHVGEDGDAHPVGHQLRTASTEDVLNTMLGRRPVGFQ